MRQPIVYGEAALHIVTRLPHLAPEAPEMLFDSIAFTVGGTAGTVCWQLAMLGCPARFLGMVGNDWAGNFIMDELTSLGTDCSFVKRTGRTTRVLALLQEDGERRLVVEPGAHWTLEIVGKDAIPRTANQLTYIPGFPGYEQTIADLHARGARLIADLGFMPLLDDPAALERHALKLAPCLDTMILSGAHANDASNYALARACLAAGARTVVTTLGARGARLDTQDISTYLPAYQTHVRNTLCAGDTFVAGFLVAQLEGRSLYESVQFGQAVAALKVSQISTLPTRQQVETSLQIER